jgi:hypothetical protein
MKRTEQSLLMRLLSDNSTTNALHVALSMFAMYTATSKLLELLFLAMCVTVTSLSLSNGARGKHSVVVCGTSAALDGDGGCKLKWTRMTIPSPKK